ncbi:HAMP domain-containing histidine kinase [Clostridium sp. D2Q-11]|uniref:histidine kinase n=1 Tax=Anaeromonas frigoriresistens TaxID=2683708 RepID=A0A942Z8Z6_9FIRM|nr:HAMP domain-containing sensor histidine kinase [Anaeromonas frigoriresistens]MBS4538370.1 HAMP domain-containing histidine kinase [Anaeromonas frigoriresistens]
MNSYFINPQLKKSSISLGMIMVIFIIGIFVLLNNHYSQLKEDYVHSFGGIVAKINEEDPELAKEVIPLLTTEISQEEATKGAEILREYGLSKDLENSLFPYINTTFKVNNQTFISIFIIMTLVLFIFNYYQHTYFYKRARKITSGAKNIVEGKYDTYIEEDQEGDFPKLTTAFNSMGKIIRNNLEELNKEKQFLVDLLSDISHQLKTPLSSMIVYNDILMEKELPRNKQLTFLGNNQKQLERMEWLIKSLLKLARLDVQAIKFEKENRSINRTIEEVIKSVDNKALEKHIPIHFSSKGEVLLEQDFYWVKEALINILVNSIQHSKKGEEVNIELIETPIYKRIIIEDHGTGISDEDLPNIFKRFYKAKTSKNSDSVGIGLALAKTIIEGHEGVIEAQSELGVGTKFIITFLQY